MGSAHFLTAALDMMADRIAVFLTRIEGLPAIEQQFRELESDAGPSMRSLTERKDADLLRRLILKRCIYGVDLFPMAVEVANVTLWLASFVPGLALSYLGSNLKCGDALIGVADPNVVGASDNPLFTGQAVTEAMARAAALQRELAENPDRTPEEVKRSEELGSELHEATAGLRSAFDLWTAEPLGLTVENRFVAKGKGRQESVGARHVLEINTGAVVERRESPEVAEVIAEAQEIAGRYRFFHWPLEFPHVFHRERSGFDVVVGNPPWNKVKFEMPSFLALHDPGIRGLRSGLDRDERADRLFRQRPELREEAEDAKRQAEEHRRFFRPENGYPAQGSGDTDLYKLFCERYVSIARKQGYMGVVLPRVAFLNDGSRGFRRWFFKECRPNRVDALLNNGRWAFDMEQRYTIALTTAQVGVPASGSLTVTGPARNGAEFAECVAGEGVQVDLAALAAWTPAPADDSVKEPTWELPLLPTAMHVRVLSKLRNGIRFDRLQPPESQRIAKDPAAAPHLSPYTELHEAQQRGLFTHPPGEGRIPVWKGRSFDQYDPHGREPVGYAMWDETLSFVHQKRRRSPVFRRMFPADFLASSDTHPIHRCRIAFRDATRGTDSRTVRACLVPPCTPLTDTAPYLVFMGWGSLAQANVIGVMNSAPFDWLSRRYVEQHLKYFILNPLTFPPLASIPWERIGRLATRLSCPDERFAGFAAEAGVEYGPLTDAERSDMRVEIDALVARAYDLTVDELRFIFTDFTESAISMAYRELVIEKFEGL